MEIGHPVDDSCLIEACLRGDLKAWSCLTQKYSPLIYASINNRLKKYGFTLPYQEIEDIRQNVLMIVWRDRKLDTVRNRQDISYWLAIVSGNIAVEYMRTRSARDSQRLVPLPDEPADGSADKVLHCGFDPLEKLMGKEASKKIEKSIEILPPKERLIIELNIYHDKKYHEIAELLHMPKGTVSSYIKRAKAKLKRHLKDL